MKWPLFVLLASTTLACRTKPEPGPSPGHMVPDINIEAFPSVLDFGVVNIGDDPVVRTFTITSVGYDPATILAIDIQGLDARSFLLMRSFEETILESGDSIDIEIAFIPTETMNEEEFTQAVIFSDTYEGTFPVTLFGQALPKDLKATPNPVVFEDTYVGCTTSTDVVVENIGLEDIQVSEMIGLDAPFSVQESDMTDLLLAPGDSVELTAEFQPLSDGQFRDDLEINSNAQEGLTVVNMEGVGLLLEQLQQEWTEPTNSPTDILFALDRTGSMQNDLNILAASFDTFITELSTHTDDWQVMVVTDDDGCSNYSGILTPNTPNYQDLFTAGVSNGGSNYGGLSESLIEMAQVAINNTDAGECNAGFLRDNAMLHVIMVSDEPEQSNLAVSDMVNDIIAKKGNADRVTMSAICDRNVGLGDRYEEAVTMTDGLVFDINNATSNNWAATTSMELFADESVVHDQYTLDQEPVQGTMVVTVNGTQVSAESGWHYDTAGQAVIFDANAPSEGDVTTIQYNPLATECE